MPSPRRLRDRKPAVILLAAILAVVALLAMVNASDWFELRPATGTAAAMAAAAEPAPAPR